eukprot:gb/GECH01014946.1/.p1 GENE.gb/GECH01014946.1/~~gb/GECH01014946.1/.p1  ORF type:complete len:336 (+),score=59.90 gb/GECH01014946.1/:1-1008(+)
MRYTDTPIDTQGPSRCHATISSVNGKLYVIGGMSHRFKYVNVFNIEELTWKTIETKGSVPSQLWGHSAAVVEDRYIYIWGGRTPARRTQLVLVLDTEKLEWIGIRRFVGPAPKACTEHSCTTWTNDRLIIFGGFNGEITLAHTYFYHIKKAKWEEMKQEEGVMWPGTRCGHAALMSPHGKYMLVFGGYRSDHRYLNDTWLLDLSSPSTTTAPMVTSASPDPSHVLSPTAVTPQWHPVLTASDRVPHPRTGAVHGLVGKYGMVLLGHMHTTFLSDVWLFDFETQEWKTEAPCSMLSDAGMGWIGTTSSGAMYVVPAFQHTVQHIIKITDSHHDNSS